MKSKQHNGFTALRILAALLVLVTHGTGLLRVRQDYLGRHHLPQLSELAVDAFFVISGFLIFISLKKNPNPFIYIRNRCLRIFPGLLGAIFFTIFIVGPIFYSGKDYWFHAAPFRYLWNITLFWGNARIPGVFDSNPITVINGSLWTLSIEVLCYIGLLLLSLCGALHSRIIIILFTLLFLNYHSDFFSEAQFFPFHCNRLGMFFLGGALIASLKDKLPFHPIFLFIGILGVVLAFSKHKWLPWHQPILFTLLYPYLIISTAINLKQLHWLDQYDCSYGIYIYSFVIQQGLIATFGVDHLSSTKLVLLTIGTTVPIALISWFWIEKPILKLKSKRLSTQGQLATNSRYVSPMTAD